MKARVIEKKGSILKLQVMHEEDGCDKCGICMMGQKKRDHIITLKNEANVSRGELVNLEFSEGRGIFMALMIFFFPALVFFTVIFSGLYAGYSEILSFAMGIAGIFLYFLCIKKARVSGITLSKINS